MGDALERDQATVFRDEGWFVHLRWADGLMLTGPIAAEAMRDLDLRNGARRRPLLVVMSKLGGITREARKEFMRPSSAARIALVGDSPVDRVLANFALGVMPPVMPTRFFTSEDDALAWLGDGRPHT